MHTPCNQSFQCSHGVVVNNEGNWFITAHNFSGKHNLYILDHMGKQINVLSDYNNSVGVVLDKNFLS